jgi:hypothetical protein
MLKVDVRICNRLIVLKISIRNALQKMVNDWNNIFKGVDEIDVDFCFYVSPFLSVTARQPHAAALPLKSYFYGPLRGRRSALPPSRFAR